MKHQQLQYILGGFNKTYEEEYIRLFCLKIGLTFKPETRARDKDLIDLLMGAFFASSADFTQAFRDMSETEVANWLTCKGSCSEKNWGLSKLNQVKKFRQFAEAYTARLKDEGISEAERMTRMKSINPRYILRNWIAQKAIEKAEKEADFSMLDLVLKTLSKPFEEQDEAERHGFASQVPEWSKDLVVSCSS